MRRALVDVRQLEAFGVRKAGSNEERRAANMIVRRLRYLGYQPETVFVRLPNGRTSVYVRARATGRSKRVVVLGAHIDSKSPSPGANDNGTGVAAVLEIARVVAAGPRTTPTVEFVFFGAEERIDANPDHHHFGSRAYVRRMSASAKRNTAGMVSVDMIGYGPHFVVRNMGRGTKSLVSLLLAEAKPMKLPLTYLRDPGKSGWSDHEPFELAGIPAAWLEWRDDPACHTSRDRSGRVSSAKVAAAGRLTLQLLRSLDSGDLERLARR